MGPRLAESNVLGELVTQTSCHSYLRLRNVSNLQNVYIWLCGFTRGPLMEPVTHEDLARTETNNAGRWGK